MLFGYFHHFVFLLVGCCDLVSSDADDQSRMTLLKASRVSTYLSHFNFIAVMITAMVRCCAALCFEMFCQGQSLTLPSFHMADGGLLLIFRGMSTEDLLDAREALMAQFLALGPYASQTVGVKSFTKDTSRGGLQSQLEAIQFVLNERGSPGGYEGMMITDFSQGMPQGQPAGTTDQLSY